MHLPEDFEWWSGVFSPAECVAHFAALEGLPWETHYARLFGRVVPMPRLVAFFGPHAYAYSGTSHPACPLPDCVEAIRARVEALTERPFNTALANLYRDGRDSMGWHSDDDYPHGGQDCVASVSFGATRRFRLRARAGEASVGVDLSAGGLLLMGPGAQTRWRHAVPRTKRPVGPRINLTFRHMAASNQR